MRPLESFKIKIVELILSGRIEEALNELASFYQTSQPRFRVGVAKGRCQGVYGLYDPTHATIYLSDGEYLTDPRTILHEFYHHLRFRNGRHRGTEKHADRFALDFIQSYLNIRSLPK